MKILYIITLCELGGAQNVVVNLANHFAEENDVVVAAGEGDGKMWQMLGSKVKTVQLRHLKRELSPATDMLALLELRELYRKTAPDIVHLHSSKAGLLGRIAFPKSKTVYTIHGFDSIRSAYRRFLPIERLMQARCSAIVGVCGYDIENLRRERIGRHLFKVYNGIEECAPMHQEAIGKIGGYQGKVLCIARICRQKRVDLFLEVARMLPQYAFIWIGNQHPVECGVPANLFFMGNLLNAGCFCCEADLFFLPSNYEGLPIVVLEAMSQGLPIVASNVGGLQEMVANGENGYLLDNNPVAFSLAIDEILSDSAKRERFGKRSQKIFNSRFSYKSMLAGYRSVYRRVAEQGKRKAALREPLYTHDECG